MSKKKDKFYVYIIWITKICNTLKSHKKRTQAELIFLYWNFNKLLQGFLQISLFVS